MFSELRASGRCGWFVGALPVGVWCVSRMLNTASVIGGGGKSMLNFNGALDLAAGNAAGGQHPIHTAEREHEVCVCGCVCVCGVCVCVCVYIIARQAGVRLCALVVLFALTHM